MRQQKSFKVLLNTEVDKPLTHSPL